MVIGVSHFTLSFLSLYNHIALGGAYLLDSDIVSLLPILIISVFIVIVYFFSLDMSIPESGSLCS